MKTQIPQSMMLEIKYIGPTNTRGSRVKITSHDVSHRNGDKPKSKFISYNYETSDINEMVLMHIKKTAPKLKPIALNSRRKDINIMFFKWDWDSMCKLMDVKLERELENEN